MRLAHVRPRRPPACKTWYLTGMATKVFSARLDEDALDLMDRVTEFLGITKRQFLEEAIRMRAEHDEIERKLRIIRETAGAWKRDETPEETIRQIKEWSEREWERRAERLGNER